MVSVSVYDPCFGKNNLTAEFEDWNRLIDIAARSKACIDREDVSLMPV